ncbi:MAG TPA: VOC family protein [Acidobacteriota bacterium]|nr:VOC family protein [Acidobacteriota bacterium]
MKIKNIAFTGYPVTDMKKAKAFYEGVLGLKQTSNYEDKFIEYDIGTSTLSIGVGSQFKPNSGGGSVALEVENFDDAIKTLKKNKVKFLFEPQDFGVCNMVGISDPDGNTLLIHKKK